MLWFWFFIAYSFLGYLLEKIFAFMTNAKQQTRKCFLISPLCPVYGISMLAILAFDVAALPTLPERILLCALIATAVEYLLHWFYELLFSVRFWDYRGLRTDINGRICLPFSIIWGVLATFALRYIHPQLQLLTLIPLPLGNIALLLLAIDTMYSARILLRYHDTERLSLLRFLQQRI